MKLENQNLVGKSVDGKDDHIFQCHKKIIRLEAEIQRIREDNTQLRRENTELQDECIRKIELEKSKDRCSHRPPEMVKSK